MGFYIYTVYNNTLCSPCASWRAAGEKDRFLFGRRVTVGAKETTVTVMVTPTVSILSPSAVRPNRACPHGTLKSAPPLSLQHTAVATTQTRGLWVLFIMMAYVLVRCVMVIFIHFYLLFSDQCRPSQWVHTDTYWDLSIRPFGCRDICTSTRTKVIHYSTIQQY